MAIRWIKQHLRIKAFYGTSENAVKTQIWIAVSIYVLVAIVKKLLKLDQSLYTILQVLSVTLFEKTPILQVFSRVEYKETEGYIGNPLQRMGTGKKICQGEGNQGGDGFCKQNTTVKLFIPFRIKPFQLLRTRHFISQAAQPFHGDITTKCNPSEAVKKKFAKTVPGADIAEAHRYPFRSDAWGRHRNLNCPLMGEGYDKIYISLDNEIPFCYQWEMFGFVQRYDVFKQCLIRNLFTKDI